MWLALRRKPGPPTHIQAHNLTHIALKAHLSDAVPPLHSSEVWSALRCVLSPGRLRPVNQSTQGSRRRVQSSDFLSGLARRHVAPSAAGRSRAGCTPAGCLRCGSRNLRCIIDCQGIARYRPCSRGHRTRVSLPARRSVALAHRLARRVRCSRAGGATPTRSRGELCSRTAWLRASAPARTPPSCNRSHRHASAVAPPHKRNSLFVPSSPRLRFGHAWSSL